MTEKIISYCLFYVISWELISMSPGYAMPFVDLSECKGKFEEREFGLFVQRFQKNFLRRKLKEANRKMAEDLLGNGMYQEASWAYQRAGNASKGLEIEGELIRTMERALEAGFDLDSLERKFLKGSTGAELIELDASKGIKAVLKRDQSNRSNAFHEEAAYRLDRMLGLGKVPVTLASKDGKISLQYFLSQGLPPHGKDVELDNDLRFFDFLIKNIDRNRGNYLLTPYRIQNRYPLQMAIDHGMTFRTTSHPRIPKMSIKKFIPRRKVYLRLKQMNDEDFRVEFSGLLTPQEMDSLLQRKSYLLGLIAEHLEQHGPKGIWNEANNY